VLRCGLLLNLPADWVSLVQELETKDAVLAHCPAELDWPATSDLVLRCGSVLDVPAHSISFAQLLATEDAVPLLFPAELD
jgi:hypothetical protein